LNWLDHTRLRSLEPHEVNFEDITFYIPNYSDPFPLRKSIERVGILNRPVVQHLSNGIIPVLGRRRLQAAVAVGIREVDVLVVSSEMPATDGFLLAFMDNAANRIFDSAFNAVVVKRLLDLFPVDLVAREFLPILGVPLRGPRLERLRLLGNLEHHTLKWLADGRIVEKTAVLMAQLDPPNRALLLDVLDRLGMNANKNAEVVENLFDLSVYHAKPPADLLLDATVQELLIDNAVPTPEQAGRFRDLVRSWKFPELVDKERAFREWHANLPVSQNTKVRPAQSFETEECTVEIRVADRARAQRVLEMLKDIG